jgi:hypothetical protein
MNSILNACLISKVFDKTFMYYISKSLSFL